MKSKLQKKNEARKTAEALKAKKKAVRMTKNSGSVAAKPGVKGKSSIPQSKKKS